MSAAPARLRSLSRIRQIPASAWDALFPASYPFTRHAFLLALEEQGCVGGDSGWDPCHLVLESAEGRPLAAAPLYRKQHSFGEFVFDWSWARASQALGRPYYPKLVCAIPFTPVGGPRIGAVDAPARAALVDGLLQQAQSCSSLHTLFAQDAELQACTSAGFLLREDLQFHWRNHGYADFGDFLARLSHDKRKKILRERRRVAEAGLRFEVEHGEDLSESAWAEVFALYANTYEERGQPPYLTLAFFLDYGRRPGSPLRLILCFDGSRLVAAAITLVAGDCLYGRHWGAAMHYHSLHFETCYYQGIALCLREGLTRFDAGAQGEHKRARGFEPVVTRSAHWLADERLRRAVAAFLGRERQAVAEQHDELRQRGPFRRAAEAAHG